MAEQENIQGELLRLQAEDLTLRDRLELRGELESQGYHPEMEAVHVKNASRLKEIIRAHGWPGKSVAGAAGAEAAWLILQHAIGDPDLQRGAVPLLEKAVKAGEAPPWQLAYLHDRIAFFEGRPQKYGTHSDYAADGYLTVCPLLDEKRVDVFRKEAGLSPLEKPSREGVTPAAPEWLRQRNAEMHDWCVKKGWRSQ